MLAHRAQLELLASIRQLVVSLETRDNLQEIEFLSTMYTSLTTKESIHNAADFDQSSK